MSNIYLFLGEEKLIINNKIDRVITSTKVDEYNITSYDSEEINLSAIVRDAQTLPFMANHKVVIIKNPIFLSNEKSAIIHNTNDLIKYINNPCDYTTLIINASGIKVNERGEIFKLLKTKANINDTKELTEVEFIGWIKRQCDLEGITIKDDAAKQFYTLVGRDLTNAKTEMEKLVCYVGKNSVVTINDINAVVTKSMQNDVYILTNALLNKDKKKAIQSYSDLIKSGKDIMMLFNLVIKAMKDNLLVNIMLKNGLKQAEIATKMKVSPNKAYYLVKNARLVNETSTKEYIVKLAELDYKIKSGQIDIKTGFELFLFSAE